MPAERLPMRQVREVLRLHHVCGQSGHRIAMAVGISRYTVAEYLRRAAVVGITWPVPPELDDAALERKLFTPPGAITAEKVRPQPDWARIHAELRRAGVISTTPDRRLTSPFSRSSGLVLEICVQCSRGKAV